MNILQVKQYNAYDMARYNKRVAEWRQERGNNIIPQIAFFGFRLPNGEMRKNGYVVFDDNSAYFFKNEKKAIEKIDLK